MNLALLETYEAAVRRMASATAGVESKGTAPTLVEYRKAHEALHAARYALEASGVLASKRSDSCLQREVRVRQRAKPPEKPIVSIDKIRAHLRANGDKGGWDKTKFGSTVAP